LKKLTNIFLLLILFVIVFSCKEEPGQPYVLTSEVTDITQVSAVSGGNVISDGGAEIIERGVCWNVSGNPNLNDYKITVTGQTGLFTCNLPDLLSGTRYYIRAYAMNKTETGYGDEIIFNTLPSEPVILATIEITSVTAKGAVSGGNISDAGGSTINAKGVCWAKTENPTTNNYKTNDGSGTDLYNSYLTGLEPETTYYVRAYAANNNDTYYGNQFSFTTAVLSDNPVIFNPDLDYGLLTDNEGNQYRTVQIGDQTWMAENLRTTKYKDGTGIINVITDIEWNSCATGAYSWYNNDITYKGTYGALYNWYCVGTGKICPIGWHIPSHDEWIELTDKLGGNSVAGGLMKETGTTHWQSPNTDATNESGFTGLPAGIRTVTGYFQEIGNIGRWWKSTEGNVVQLFYDNSEVKTDIGCVYRRGLSVRCIRDF
jgi:uncharacterized protein (TIGR02145 family)